MKLLNDWLLIKPLSINGKDFSETGLIEIPDMFIEVGIGEVVAFGEKVSIPVEIGDYATYGHLTGGWIVIDGQELLKIRQSYVFAVDNVIMQPKIVVEPLMRDSEDLRGLTRESSGGILYSRMRSQTEYPHIMGVVKMLPWDIAYHGEKIRKYENVASKPEFHGLYYTDEHGGELLAMEEVQMQRLYAEAEPYGFQIHGLMKNTVKCKTRSGMNLDVGDIVQFHYLSENNHKSSSIGRREYAGGMVIDYDLLYCAIKGVSPEDYLKSKNTGGIGDLVMLNGWCLMEAEKVWVKSPFSVREDGLTEVPPKPKQYHHGWGHVTHLGDVVEDYVEGEYLSDTDEIKIGDRIFVDPKVTLNTIGNKITQIDDRVRGKFRFRRKDVLAL